jgi:hypothetical protein
MTINDCQLTIDEDDEGLTIGFLESQGDRIVHYLLIQTPKKNSSEELVKTQSGYYIELDDQLYSTYGGVDHILFSDNQLVIWLNQKGQEKLKSQRIDISYILTEAQRSLLEGKLTEVFGAEKVRDS